MVREAYVTNVTYSMFDTVGNKPNDRSHKIYIK